MRSQALRLLQRSAAGDAASEAFASCGVVLRSPAVQLEALFSAPAPAALAAPARGIATVARREHKAASAAGWQLPLALRSVSSSAAPAAQALTQVAVEGDVEGLIKAIDGIVSSESATAKDVADAAVSLAYLQVKGNRRIWGKVFEKALAVKSTFDATSLPAFLWATTTANVTHFKTIFELAGAVPGLLKSLSPANLSVVVEALGKAQVKDSELLLKIGDHVLSKVGDYKGADLARVLWALASVGVEDAKLVKALSAALTAKAAELSAREAAQAMWALATLRRADKPLLDALAKALKGKGGLETAADAGAAVWAAATLGYKVDTSALAAALKSGASELSAEQAIQAAWGLALGGSGEKDAISALFAVAASAIDKAPDSVAVSHLAELYEASVAAPDAKLAENAKAYALRVYSLAADAQAAKRGGAALALRADVAVAAARAAGARYRPEVAAQLKGFKRVTAEGVTVGLAVDIEKEKFALEVVDAAGLTATAPHTPLGSALARAKVLGALGFKAVLVPETDWAALKDDKAKAQWLLAAVLAAAPSSSSRLNALRKKLDEPFDAYAE